MCIPGKCRKWNCLLTYGDINWPLWILKVLSSMFYIIKEKNNYMSTQFKTEKSCKGSVNHNIKRVASAYSRSPYMVSRRVISPLLRDDVIIQ